MKNLAERMSQWLSKPVVDQSGLTGSYDFEALLIPEDSSPGMELNDSLDEALKRLGLQLSKGSSLIQALVVDLASPPGNN